MLSKRDVGGLIVWTLAVMIVGGVFIILGPNHDWGQSEEFVEEGQVATPGGAIEDAIHLLDQARELGARNRSFNLSCISSLQELCDRLVDRAKRNDSLARVLRMQLPQVMYFKPTQGSFWEDPYNYGGIVYIPIPVEVSDEEIIARLLGDGGTRSEESRPGP